MATASELRWIQQNPGYFSPDTPDGVVARYAQKWYQEPEQANVRPDATDSAMFNEFNLSTPGFTPSAQSPFSTPPPAANNTASGGISAAAYGESRPDLLTNWQRAHDASWISANPGSQATVDYIKNFGSLNDYLQADYGSPFASPINIGPITSRDLDTNQGTDLNPIPVVPDSGIFTPTPSSGGLPNPSATPIGTIDFDGSIGTNPYGSTGENNYIPPGSIQGPNGTNTDDGGSYPGPSSNTSGWPTASTGNVSAQPTGNSTWGSTTAGNPINYPIGNGEPNQGGIGSPSIGFPSSGGGGIGNATVLPLPIGPAAAIAASILLSNGNIFGAGTSGGIGPIANRVGEIASNPIGSVGSSLQNLGQNIFGPPGQGAATAGVIAFPTGGSSSGGGSTPGSSGGTQPVDQAGGTSIFVPPINPPVNNGIIPPVTSGSPVEQNQPQTIFTPPVQSIIPPPSANTQTDNGPDHPTIIEPIPPPPSSTSTNTDNPPNNPVVVTPGAVGGPTNTNTDNQPTTPTTAVVPVPTPVTNPPPNSNPGIVIPPIITPNMPTDTSIASPLDRNYYREGNQSNQDLASLYPQIAALYGQASGGQAQTDYSNLQNLLSQYGITNQNLSQIANQQTVGSNTALRQGNVNDIGQLGGQALSYLQMLNPNQYQSLNQAQAGAGQIGQSPYQQQLGQQFASGPQFQQVGAQQSNSGLNYAQGQLGQIGPSSLQQMLQQGAQQNLALGGQLSAQDMNQAQQAAREAWSARGLINSPGAVGAEILNTDALSRQRLAERQQAAQSIDAANFGQIQQGFNNALNYSGAAQGYAGLGLQAGLANQQAGLQAQQQNYGLGTNLMSAQNALGQQNYANVLQNAALQSQSAFNPFSTITSATTQNQGLNQNLYNQVGGISSGQMGNQYAQQMYNPFNPYAQDVYGSNFNAANARNISAGNNAAAIQGANTANNAAIANGFLRFAGQYLSCWVARSCYGVDNPKWLMFRFWMYHRGPKWFKKFYVEHGERFAAWLDRHSWLKPVIKAWMDSRIQTLNHI